MNVIDQFVSCIISIGVKSYLSRINFIAKRLAAKVAPTKTAEITTGSGDCPIL